MTNQSQAKKISEFLAQTSLPADTELTLVSGGTNYKISLADFQAALGVTGTIVQDGEVTGTPVLDTQGSVNNIRNLVNGSGIIVSITAENGAKIAHNFTEDTTGAELVTDLTVDSPVFRSLTAGTGINIAVSGDTIQISAPGATVASNVVIVNDMSDFPDAASGVRTLAADTAYLVSGNISTSDRFVTASNSVIFGSDPLVSSLTYTGTGVMFTGTNVSNRFSSITLDASASGASLLALTCTGASTMEFDSCDITADNLGTVSGYKLFEFDDCDINAVTDGLDLSGSNTEFMSHNCRWDIDAGVGVDLGTATFDSVKLALNVADIASGATFVSGAASSANINSGGLGTMMDNTTLGAGTPISGLSADDARWQFRLNSDIEDTNPSGLLSMPSNATETVIAVAGTPVLVAGTWTVEDTSQFTGTAGGRLTYNGDKTITVDAMFSCTCSPASGGTVEMSVQIAKNGTPITNSARKGSAASGGGSSITCPWRVSLSNGDYVEAFVTNEDSTVNVIVGAATGRVS